MQSSFPATGNTAEENAPEFPYVQMDPLEMDASSNDGDRAEIFEHLSNKKVSVRCCVVDVFCCVRRSFFLAMVVAVVMASVTIVKVRDGIFQETTPSDYYLRDSSAYVAFLFWGDAGTEDLLLNFSSTGQRSAYGTQLTSTSAWENICPRDQMELFVSGKADERCSYLNPGGYVQGCTDGFYQPNADFERAPLPCPDGFMCPRNFLCTVACVPGSQCFNSSFVPDSGTCEYPSTMEGGRPADPLAITTNAGPSNEASLSSTELVCPGSGNMYLCRGGFYCKTALTSQPCPEGHYCPIGSIAPKKCAAIAKCPPRVRTHASCIPLLETYRLALLFLSPPHRRSTRRTGNTSFRFLSG